MENWILRRWRGFFDLSSSKIERTPHLRSSESEERIFHLLGRNIEESANLLLLIPPSTNDHLLLSAILRSGSSARSSTLKTGPKIEMCPLPECEERLSPGRSDLSASRPARPHPASPTRRAPPRPDPPVICPCFGFDRSCHVMSSHVMLSHVTSSQGKSKQIMSRRVTLCDVTSCHVTPRHVAPEHALLEKGLQRQIRRRRSTNQQPETKSAGGPANKPQMVQSSVGHFVSPMV